MAVLLALWPAILAHMPMSGDPSSASALSPYDIGDPTANSVVILQTLQPGQAVHFSFNVRPDYDSSKLEDGLCMGLYVPGDGRAGTFKVAIFGLDSNTECDRWGDGWGRRRLVAPPPAEDVPEGIRLTSEGTTWIDNTEDAVPSSITGGEDAPSPYQASSVLLLRSPRLRRLEQDGPSEQV